jgi:ATP-dependent helicase/nuclease subunit A
MTTPERKIPDVARRTQMEAADPSSSAWVSANAGSGKTHVLAQRVINLLLDGVDPAKILCITFTRAAAANMANRVFGELRKWTALDDDALDRAIRSVANVTPDARLRALARRLFATALDAPGGLKVQTIHAFCTRLLQQFPFEANVAARFSVLDETTQRNLLEEIVLAVLLDAAAEPQSSAGRALAIAITAAADQTFQDAVNATIGKRNTLEKWIDGAGGLDAAIAGLSRALGIEPNETQDDIERDIVDGPISSAVRMARGWGDLPGGHRARSGSVRAPDRSGTQHRRGPHRSLFQGVHRHQAETAAEHPHARAGKTASRTGAEAARRAGADRCTARET